MTNKEPFRNWRNRHFPGKTHKQVCAWFLAEHNVTVSLVSLEKWLDGTRNPRPQIKAIMAAKDES